MAAKTVTNYKDYSATAQFPSDERWVEATYDFNVSGGATTDTYSFFKLPVGYMITDAALHIETAFTGATSTYEVGVTGATAGIIAQTAVSAMTENAVKSLAGKQIVGTNNTVFMTIGTAAATAGKATLYVKIKPAK